MQLGRVALIAVVLGTLLTACGDTAGSESDSRAAGIATCHTVDQYEMHFATSDLAENYFVHPRLGAHLAQTIVAQSARAHDQHLISAARALVATTRTPVSIGKIIAIFDIIQLRCRSYGVRPR
jgi:hypothetical protein